MTTLAREEWEPLQSHDGDWGPLGSIDSETKPGTQTRGGDGGGKSHTHDGAGTNSTVVGGVAESGSAAPSANSAQGIAIGDFSSADDVNATVNTTGGIAIGAGTTTSNSARAKGPGAIAIGTGAATRPSEAFLGSRSLIAIGRNAAAGPSGGQIDGSIALGDAADVAGAGGVGIGAQANVDGADGIAIGRLAGAAVTTGVDSIQIGGGHNSTEAPASSGSEAIAIGSSGDTDMTGPRASGARSVSIGGGSIASSIHGPSASGTTALAVMMGAVASGTSTVAIGRQASASATNGVAIGLSSVADQASSVALGASANTDAANQLMLGTSSEHVKMPGGQVGRVNVQTGTTYTATLQDHYIVGNNATGLTVTLPDAVAGNVGLHLVIKNINATNLTVHPDGGTDNIDGSTSDRTLAQYEVFEAFVRAAGEWNLVKIGAP